jgi:effector-binding domain-containing protein
MTSIEWLIRQLNKQGFAQVVTDQEIQQAKEIHMVETLLFAKKYNEYISKGGIDTMEEYYQELFEKPKKD